MKTFIVTFQNTHQVLNAEKKLRLLLDGVTTVPTPAELSSDCGVSLRLQSGSISSVKDALTGEGLPYTRIMVSG